MSKSPQSMYAQVNDYIPPNIGLLVLDNEEEDLVEERSLQNQARGFDSIVERLKVQLTAKNGRIQYLKDIIKQLEEDLFKSLHSKPSVNVDKARFLKEDRNRVRVSQLQNEVTTLSGQVRELQQEKENQHAQNQGNVLQVQRLLEELEKERGRMQKMSVQLAACRRIESNYKNLETELWKYKSEKRKRDLEHQSNSYILKINKMKRLEHTKLFRHGIEGMNAMTNMNGKKNTPPRSRQRSPNGRKKTDSKQMEKEMAASDLLPRPLQSHDKIVVPPQEVSSPALLLPRYVVGGGAASQETSSSSLLLPRRVMCSHEFTEDISDIPHEMPTAVLPRALGSSSCRQEGSNDLDGNQVDGSNQDCRHAHVLLPRSVDGDPEAADAREEKLQQDLNFKLQSIRNLNMEKENVNVIDEKGASVETGCVIISEKGATSESRDELSELDELDVQHEILQLRRDLGFKTQTIKNLDAQLRKRDEEIQYLQTLTLAGSPSLPRPIVDDSEDGGGGDMDVKQLQIELALRSQTIKHLNAQLDKRDEEIKFLQMYGSPSSSSSTTLAVPLHEAFDEAAAIKHLRDDAAAKTEVIEHLKDEVERRDEIISALQRQAYGNEQAASSTDDKPWLVWDNNCYEEDKMPSTAAEVRNATLAALHKRIREVENELFVMRKENSKMKSDIEAVDPALFEEFEDLKSEHHELRKVCEGYERMLHSYCGQLGFAFKPLRSL